MLHMTTVKDDRVHRETIPTQPTDSPPDIAPLPPSSPLSPSSSPQSEGRQQAWKLLLLLFLAATASLTVELICGGSICAGLRLSGKLADKFISALVPLFNVDSVSKVAETIGVCSILIAWIYASLDKVELGIQYSTLVDLRLTGYHFYVAAHFIGVLLCIWLSTAKMLESAVLILFAVLYDSWLQWDVLYWIVLSSKCRQELVIKAWCNRVETAKDAKSTKELALEMAEIIATKDMSETLLLQKELARLLLRYEAQCREEDKEQGAENAVEGASWIFGHLLQRKPADEQILLSKRIFFHYKEENISCSLICAGYVLWLVKSETARCEQDGKKEEEALRKARNILEIVAQGDIQKNIPDILQNWRMVFTVLMWLLFEYRLINLDKDLMKTWTKQECRCLDTDRVLLQAAANVYFRRTIPEGYFSAALSMMWKN